MACSTRPENDAGTPAHGRTPRLLLPLFVLASFSPDGSLLAQAESSEGILRAHRLTEAEGEAFRLDGLLAESAWSVAPAIGRLTMQEPFEGSPSSEETQVMVLYDRENLYVGIRALDSDPEAIVRKNVSTATRSPV